MPALKTATGNAINNAWWRATKLGTLQAVYSNRSLLAETRLLEHTDTEKLKQYSTNKYK